MTIEHHIPIELDVLEEGLTGFFPEDERPAFHRLAQRMQAHWAVELQERLAGLRRTYRPFDPSRDTIPVPGEEASEGGRRDFLDELAQLLGDANYIELTADDIDRAIAAVSPEGVEVSVDREEHAELRVFVRGQYQRDVEVRRLWQKSTEQITGYRRLALAVALRSEPDCLHLRLYKDVTENDLEMFLPNTNVRIRFFDKVKLGVTGGGGTVGGVIATASKVGAATSPIGWAVALAGLAGVLWRQVRQVFYHRTRYMARHAQALYFHSLDNDLGALVHVAQMAVQQEVKEALVAYAVLATAGETLGQPDLDERIEAHLLDHHGVRADFEIEGGLEKLRGLQLLQEKDGAFGVLGLEEALVSRGW